MIICIEVSQRTKDQIERLLNDGGYRDYSEVVAVAVSNQELLHSQAKEASTKTIAPVVDSDRKNASTGSQYLPPLFGTLLMSDEPRVKIAPFAEDSPNSNQEIFVDRWLWGQHNKLLPVKASCRALANLMLRDASSSSGLPLEKAASEIASEAVILGDYLRSLDERLHVHRDDASSFAFPSTGATNSDKSRLRYANQFVAAVNKQGVLTGLPVELKLVNKDDSRIPRLLLTEAGWCFAKLKNPILDGNGDHTFKKFTDEEISFLLRHIRDHVPAEECAFRAVLKAIASGANTPEKLDDALEQFLPKRAEKPFTRAFLTTQRAGVVSRMIDLGLVQRIREGINVSYATTARTVEFAAQSFRQAG